MDTTELTTTLAECIRDKHCEAQDLAKAAKERMGEAIQAAVDCGRYLDEAEGMHRGQLLGWLRDNVPGITPDQAKGYLSLFHTEAKRESHRIDAQQLRLIGIIGDSDRKDPEPRPVVANPWINLVNRAWTVLMKTEQERPVEKWPVDQRQALCTQLEPLVELYNRAKP